MRITSFASAFTIALLASAAWCAARDFPTTAPTTAPSAKSVYLPEKIWRIPEGNDFNDPASEYSFARKAESANVVIFWSKQLGEDPSTNADQKKRFDVKYALEECERFYDAYVNRLKFVDKGHSVTDQYKILFFVFGEEDGTAYGGGEDDKVGILWAPPVRISKPPYGAIAHELGHSFQYLIRANGGGGFRGAPRGSGHSIAEMTSQFMLWQVYPEWMTFENYHLVSYLTKTHFAFLHEQNMYHSPYVLEYWAGKHGVDFIGKLWRESKDGEDPVMTYQRLAQIDQNTFNDEMFDAARRFMTWDLPRVDKVARQYANQHTSELTAVGDGWYQVAQSRCPQNYGYNGIKLTVPAAGTKITLQFKGVAGAEGFRSVQPERAGWRYGFVAVSDTGERTYSDTGSAREGVAEFVVPDRTQHLWLVVMGAPTGHWPHIADGKDENDEQWPYQFRLQGAQPDPSVIH